MNLASDEYDHHCWDTVATVEGEAAGTFFLKLTLTVTHVACGRPSRANISICRLCWGNADAPMGQQQQQTGVTIEI